MNKEKTLLFQMKMKMKPKMQQKMQHKMKARQMVKLQKMERLAKLVKKLLIMQVEKPLVKPMQVKKLVQQRS